MNLPLVTIGMTSYNASDTIEDAIQSALEQDWQNKEIIIVDDCSSDNIEEIIAKYPEIRFFKNGRNLGVALARNRIIKEAKGEFIVFFDDDDVSVHNRISEQYKYITQYEDKFADGMPVICHTARTQKYPDGTIRYEQTLGCVEDSIAPNGNDVAARMLYGKPSANVFGACSTCSQMARKSVYEDLSGFNGHLRRSEDTDFNIKLAKAGGHFVGIKEPLVIQKMTLTSDKNLDDERKFNCILLEGHKGFLDNEYDYKFCVDWINAKFEFYKGHKLSFIFNMIKLLIRHPIYTLQKLYWAFPNLGFNIKFSSFHNKSK